MKFDEMRWSFENQLVKTFDPEYVKVALAKAMKEVRSLVFVEQWSPLKAHDFVKENLRQEARKLRSDLAKSETDSMNEATLSQADWGPDARVFPSTFFDERQRKIDELKNLRAALSQNSGPHPSDGLNLVAEDHSGPDGTARVLAAQEFEANRLAKLNRTFAWPRDLTSERSCEIADEANKLRGLASEFSAKARK